MSEEVGKERLVHEDMPDGKVLYIFRFRSIHCYAIHYYRYWYWMLVSLEANIIEYWVPF